MPELCPRYTARVVKGVKIGPSPDWLRSTLEKVGIRSISNVVDVTNYVMLEIGQPLHAFDYHLIAVAVLRQAQANRNRRRSRRATSQPSSSAAPRPVRNSKPSTTRNARSPNEMLLIADEQKGIALAGVMGGQNTEINEKTVDVLIESAYFSPDQHPPHQQGARPAQRIELPLRARRGHRHLRLGQPALRAIDSGNRRRPARRRRRGRLSETGRAKANHAAPSQGERLARHQSEARKSASFISANWA